MARRGTRSLSGSWIALIVALGALFVSVSQLHQGSTTTAYFTTIGVLAAGMGVAARRRIARRARGSIAVATIAVVLGTVAAIITLVRWGLMAFMPELAMQLPLITFDSGTLTAESSASQVFDEPVAQLVGDPAQELGTVVYLFGDQPASVASGIALVNGVIVMPDGSIVQAPNAIDLRVTVNEAGTHFALTLTHADGTGAHYSSRTGTVTRD